MAMEGVTQGGWSPTSEKVTCLLRSHQCLVQGEVEGLVMGPPWTTLPVCLDLTPSDAVDGGPRQGKESQQSGIRYLALPRSSTSAAGPLR